MTIAVNWGAGDQRRLGVVALVSVAHLALIIAFAMNRLEAAEEPLAQPVFDVLMMRRPRTASTATGLEAGGEGRATPSRIHVQPDPEVERAELAAPQALAPLPALEIGQAVAPSIDAGMGLGDSGEGRGLGEGDGNGSGLGRGAGPVLISGPQGAVMTTDVAASSLAALPGAYAIMQCYIRAGRDRLEDCRVKEEHPVGRGVGQAALRKAAEFRYQPPSRLGRFGGRHRQMIAVAFPPAAVEAEAAGERAR